MSTTQFTALAKKPYWGLNYDAIVKAKAASLPALYAQTDEENQRKAELNLQKTMSDSNLALGYEKLGLDKEALVGQQKYYADSAVAAKNAEEEAKKSTQTSNILGAASTAVGIYGAYNMSKVGEKIGESLATKAPTTPAPTTPAPTTPALEPVSTQPKADFGELSRSQSNTTTYEPIGETTPVDTLSTPPKQTGPDLSQDVVPSETGPGLESGIEATTPTNSITTTYSAATPTEAGAVTDAMVADEAYGTAASATPAAEGGGATFGGAMTVLAYIAAADAIRQKSGQLDRPYGERGAMAKFASAPVTGGPSGLAEAVGIGSDSNYIGNILNTAPKMEEKIAGEPLDVAFNKIGGGVMNLDAGEIAQGVEESARKSAEGLADAPGDLWEGIKSIGGTIICTELHKQGYLSDLIYENDGKYRSKVSPAVYQGYLILAKPIVKLLQESSLFTVLFAPLARLTAMEMAHRVNKDIDSSVVGQFFLGIFVPICKFIGQRKGHSIQVQEAI